MTILTSLYKLGQVREHNNLKRNIADRWLELKATASKVHISEKTKELDLKIVAMFDTCINVE